MHKSTKTIAFDVVNISSYTTTSLIARRCSVSRMIAFVVTYFDVSLVLRDIVRPGVGAGDLTW